MEPRTPQNRSSNSLFTEFIGHDFANTARITPRIVVLEYLVKLGGEDEAIPWLRKAISAKRYCCYHFAHLNLGQILLKKAKVVVATRLFEGAVKYEPDYAPVICIVWRFLS